MADYAPDPYPSNVRTEDFYGVFKRANQARVNELLSQGGDKLTAQQLGLDAAATSFLNMRSAGYLLPTGYANLGSILASQGRSDPRAMNLQLTDISRATQANQQALSEGAAQQGLAGSGLAQALQAAQGQAGVSQRSRVIAADTQQAEQRRRSDLQLMYDLIINPTLQGYGAIKGVQLGQQQLSQQRQAANQAFLATLLGGAIGAFA